MTTYKIALLPGDGIGEETCIEAVKVLDKIEKKYGHKFIYNKQLVGGAAIDGVGEPLPEATIKACEESDAVLFGSVGGPKWDHLPADQRPEVGALLPLRKHFELFANIRPAGVSKALASFSPIKPEIIGEGFNYTVIRELTGDVYFGEKTESDGEKASDLMIYHRHEVERIARLAFDLAKTQGVRVTNVDKSNVLATSRLWREVVEEIHKNEYADVELDHLYIDNATMQVLTNPHHFGVILTGNLFGDILSDESAQISGSIGMQASASLNSDNFGLYEPMGGSAPDIANQGLANPIAQIRSAAMMLEISFGLKDEAACIEQAINKTLADGIRTGDIFVEGSTRVGTVEMGDAIVERM